MATRKELRDVVRDYNRRYCRNTKHELKVDEAYGGCKVVLTGKPDRRTKSKAPARGYLRGSSVEITSGYETSGRTLDSLHRAFHTGAAQSRISFFEKKKSRRK